MEYIKHDSNANAFDAFNKREKKDRFYIIQPADHKARAILFGLISNF